LRQLSFWNRNHTSAKWGFQH